MSDDNGQRSIEAFAAEKLAALDAAGLRRVLDTDVRDDAVRIVRDGRQLISFCCNDYLNLSRDPAVIEAGVAALRDHGAGAGASRHVTGNHPLYAELESQIARLKGTEDAVVFGSGYLANVGITPCFAGAGDLILIDDLAHASMNAGAQLSRAAVHRFAHNDVETCRRLLAQHRADHARCLILTEGVFSMDGDRAPLNALADLASGYDAWLMVDDAHGLGVLGGGRGTAFACDPRPKVDLQMGTLSKAVGAYGGYLAGSRAVIDFVRTRARSLIYTTGLPPAAIGSAIAALDRIATDEALCDRPLRLARRFTTRMGLPAAESPIVPIVIGAANDAMAYSRTLQDLGYLVTAIRPPTVPDGTARLRFTFTAEHSDAQVDALADAVSALLRREAPSAGAGDVQEQVR